MLRANKYGRTFVGLVFFTTTHNYTRTSYTLAHTPAHSLGNLRFRPMTTMNAERLRLFQDTRTSDDILRVSVCLSLSLLVCT